MIGQQLPGESLPGSVLKFGTPKRLAMVIVHEPREMSKIVTEIRNSEFENLLEFWNLLECSRMRHDFSSLKENV